ncbi:hypothetical protein [Roseateles violae]|uniref:Phosphoglycerate mutase n=1 Tax=Roseateles violae TaxID=3058042 RepID=A0ABT8DQV4_9BURK|nr:hypothetical protein [Pelomonas sp. PFR6]MDN3920726.1 hypothetical protein [Pelomonas sp. PFR6]
MHLMIPYASAVDEACAHTLGDLRLPNLAAALGLLKAAGAPLGEDEYSLNTPFELALAAQRGHSGGAAGPLPTAAWLAREQGLDATLPWALLTPIHLSVGSDQVSALAPEALRLDAAESRAFFDSLAELWPAGEGWQAHWLAPTQWLLGHARFAALPCASLDRVVGRNVEAWKPEARALRTLQNEFQMLLHRNPLNEAREARGELALNSVWISGCGLASGGALPAELRIEAGLREPLLAGDWAAWAEAWRALDAGPVADLLTRLRAGDAAELTLCGERFAQAYRLPARGALLRAWQGLAPPRADTAKTLGAL